MTFNVKMKNKKIVLTLIIIISLVLCIIQNSCVYAAQGNNNPMLKSIKINGKDINPPFDMFTTEYVILVEENIEKVNIEAIPDDSNAKVKIEGDTNLKLGKNDIKIEVTAEDGQSKQTYNLYITRGDANKANANLKELKVNGYDLAPGFNKDTINYAFEYSKKVEKFDISAVPEDEKAKIEVIGNENFSNEFTTIEIKVTAKDGQTVKTYYLIAKKTGNEDEQLEGKEEREENKEENKQEETKTEENKQAKNEVENKNTESNKKENNVFIFVFVGIIIGVVILIFILMKYTNKRGKH